MKPPTTTEMGGSYLLVYSADQDRKRREILESVSTRQAFFVYDKDCYEAHALGAALQQLAKQLRSDNVKDMPAIVAQYSSRIADPHFKKITGLSDIQQQIIRAVIDMDPTTTSRSDRVNYLALTYFGNFKATMIALLPKLFNPANAMLIQVMLAMGRMSRAPGTLD